MRRIMMQKLGGVNFFVCDLVVGFIHAYSQSRLTTSAYAGDILQVLRSSDNTTAEIGDVSNELDETTLTTFVGANDGFLTTLYDQVGSVNLTPATSSNRPKIVNSGTVVKVSTKPYAQYDGSTSYLTTVGRASVLDEDCTAFVVFESQSGESNQCVMQELRVGANTNRVQLMSDTRNSTFLLGSYQPTGTALNLNFSSQQPQSTKRCFIYRRSGNDVDIYDETNTLIDSVSSALIFSDTNIVMNLGRLSGGIGSNFFGGKIAELLINNTALSSGDQTLVLNNIKAYYGI